MRSERPEVRATGRVTVKHPAGAVLIDRPDVRRLPQPAPETK